jgi:predicted Rossmann fold flavoprotein
MSIELNRDKKDERWDVAIIGGGPAGLMAAIRATERGKKTVLLDKNREPGVKILLSGGTRCNLTHATDARGIVEAFGTNGRFLYSALAAFGPQAVVDWFEAEGVQTKIEPGGKIFPESDRARDVRDALVRRAKQNGCELILGESLTDIVRIDAGFRLVASHQTFEANNVILATGGQSYPACGTTGDGYRFAAALGHRIVSPHTALAPIVSHAAWVTELQGITLPDVVVQVVDLGENNTLAQSVCSTKRRGALLFAHFGVSGPAPMDVSHAVSEFASASRRLVLRCDLLPDVAVAALDAELAEVCSQGGKRRVTGLLDAWLPHRVGETILALVGTPSDRPIAELSKKDRRRLVETVKKLDIPTAGTMGFRKAEVTAGGVALEEVDFAGELLDLNGPVGGYNFQAAFSTGRLAGENVD